MNCLLGYWLDMPDDEYEEKHLFAMSLVNLINCCYNLILHVSLAVRGVEFAE